MRNILVLTVNPFGFSMGFFNNFRLKVNYVALSPKTERNMDKRDFLDILTTLIMDRTSTLTQDAA